MKDLLLPYAYDSTGNLVYIDCARKDVTYKCPHCGESLTLNLCHIPEGQKYHRRNHFSHPKGSPDNHCSESFLHKLFKEKVAECLRQKIANNEREFKFRWFCKWCNHFHEGNLLKNSVDVRLEHDLGVCQSDIALLDKDGNVRVAIEIVVTHKPEPETLQYYKENKIGCLQIEVNDFEDCKRVEAKLSRPDIFFLWEPLYCKSIEEVSCSVPICEKCGQEKHEAKMIIGYDFCFRCNEKIRMAIIKNAKNLKVYSPEHFTKNEIEFAKANGANIRHYTSKKRRETFYANICDCCGMFGRNFLGSDYTPKNAKEYDLGYKCFYCIEDEIERKEEAKREKQRILDEIFQKYGVKKCPQCGSKMYPRIGPYGFFYGCKNYPDCKYKETVVLEE